MLTLHEQRPKRCRGAIRRLDVVNRTRAAVHGLAPPVRPASLRTNADYRRDTSLTFHRFVTPWNLFRSASRQQLEQGSYSSVVMTRCSAMISRISVLHAKRSTIFERETSMVKAVFNSMSVFYVVAYTGSRKISFFTVFLPGTRCRSRACFRESRTSAALTSRLGAASRFHDT